MILTYQYRILPTRKQHLYLAQMLEDQRVLYNAALEERIGCYVKTGKSITFFDQCKSLTAWRCVDTEAAGTSRRIQAWTLKRVDDAYAAFFRRCKSSSYKVGFPRFRSKGRWRSFGVRGARDVHQEGNRLSWKGLPGSLRIRLHRPLPAEFRRCSYTFTKDHKGWSVCLILEVTVSNNCVVTTSVGIDLGLNVFAYQSDGIVVSNPRIARRAEKELRIRQRALARCKRRSNRSVKLKHKVNQLYSKIGNTRKTWLHQQSTRIMSTYDLVAVEDLNIKGMVKHPTFARSIGDASWSKFVGMLAYKAEKAGKHLIKVNPNNTSKTCSSCGELVPKTLVVRTHSCPHCNFVVDRDWNAARNILQAVVSLEQHNVVQWNKRAARNISSEVN